MRKSAFHRSALFKVSILIALLCLFIMAYSANALYLGWTIFSRLSGWALL